MATKHTVHNEVAMRLHGPGATPKRKGELESALASGELETVTGKLKSCALACGVPAKDVDEAVEAFAEHCLMVYGDDVGNVEHDDATVEAYFEAYGSALTAPPPEKVPPGPEADKKLARVARRISNSGHGGGGNPPA